MKLGILGTLGIVLPATISVFSAFEVFGALLLFPLTFELLLLLFASLLLLLLFELALINNGLLLLIKLIGLLTGLLSTELLIRLGLVVELFF